MKRVLMFVILAATIVSCGKKDDTNKDQTQPAAAPDTYSVVLDGTYPKNDTIIVYYQLMNVFQYDQPIKTAVKGSELAQRLTVDIPDKIKPENFVIVVSTNKEQAYISLPNITVMKNNKILADGANSRHSTYFMTDHSFKWDDANQRFELNHGNQYPPAFTGKPALVALLGQ